jgi:hypothetical protein
MVINSKSNNQIIRQSTVWIVEFILYYFQERMAQKLYPEELD